MTQHSKFSPSQLTRIISCPGSVADTEDIPRESSTYAQEGTMLHSVVEECINLGEYTLPELTKKKFSLDTEQAESVQEVLDWVFALRAQHHDSTEMFDAIESKVYLAPYIDLTGCELLNDTYGTLDYSLVVPEEQLVYIVDWKFGKGVEVWPDTAQLKAYALGRLAALDFTITKVILVIGQPRLYSGELFKSHETTPEELISWLQSDLVPALNNTQSKHPTYCPTEAGCRWCAVKSTCKYRRNLAFESAAQVFAMHATLPDQIDDTELADFLTKIPDLKKYIADLELYASNSLKAGKEIPGWKLVAGRSIRQWKDVKAAQMYYADRFDIEDLTITKFKSPTQIEKLIGKRNITDEDLALVVKPEGKPTMVKDTDRRPALVFETAEDKFTKYVQE